MRPPKTPTVNAQHAAVNHVEKFLAEEFVVGAKGHTQISVFVRAYDLWCAARDVRNRKLSPVALLDYLERRHSIAARTCYTGKYTHVFALARIEFRQKTISSRPRSGRGRSGIGSVAQAWRDIRGPGSSEEDNG